MLTTNTASPGLLFASFLYRTDLHSLSELTQFWEKHFGPSFSFVPEFNPLNEYYSKEMGQGLSRVFFLTAASYSRDHLLKVKLQSMQWENTWAENNQRRVNVDIGLLSLENFILATTKNYSHRVYVGQDIFADLTYYFHQGAFQTLSWTYPDFLDLQKKDFLEWGRSFLLHSMNLRRTASN
ncbi:MAG: DUF4416 family protein [Bacteriovoracaceae bacterium]|nr:DUF4416 family protein [Bacteriovoracaceae bacterium]